MQNCKRCGIPDYVPGNVIGDKQCSYCDWHDDMESKYQFCDFVKIVEKMKDTDNQFHCLIGISGGFDSAYLLDLAIRFRLNPLVIHFDNSFNTPEANDNIEKLISKTGVTFIRYHVDQKVYNDCCLATLYAGVTEGDITNDMVMSALMIRASKEYGIKYILNGHDYRAEGTCPLEWTYMDARYIKDLYYHHTGVELTKIPISSFWEQVRSNVQQIRPLYYLRPNMEQEKKHLIKKYDLSDYGSKHSENYYTKFVGSVYLPNRFYIDKNLLYMSAKVRSGMATLSDFEEYKQTPYKSHSSLCNYITERFGMDPDFVSRIISNPEYRTYKDFKTYHKQFRRFRFLIYILMKMNIVPSTFYYKYTK